MAIKRPSPKVITPALAAALASGVPAESLEGDEENNDPDLSDEERVALEAQEETARLEAETQEAARLEAEEQEAARLEAETAAAQGGQNALVEHLRTELKAANTELVTLRAQGITDKASLQNYATVVPGLTESVRKSAQRLAVACGGTVPGLDSLEGVALVAMFNSLDEQVQKKYPVGGKSKVAADPVPTKESINAPVNPLQAAQLSATQLPKRN